MDNLIPGIEQLLNGNAVAGALLIKLLISAAKQIYTTIPIRTIRILSLLLGIPTAFVMNISLTPVVACGVVVAILSKVLSGLVVGALAMGVHETMQLNK